MTFPKPNDIEFSGERKRVRCNEGLGQRPPSAADETRWRCRERLCSRASTTVPRHSWRRAPRCAEASIGRSRLETMLTRREADDEGCRRRKPGSIA